MPRIRRGAEEHFESLKYYYFISVFVKKVLFSANNLFRNRNKNKITNRVFIVISDGVLIILTPDKKPLFNKVFIPIRT